jgi:hypothetical protein
LAAGAPNQFFDAVCSNTADFQLGRVPDAQVDCVAFSTCGVRDVTSPRSCPP